MTDNPLNRPRRRDRIPRVVWTLGFVSLFMDLSSEIVHGLLPVFLTATLGASVAFVGLIDGIAESTAAIAKVFSGYISDRLGRRKPLILLGYGLAALSKPMFPLAGGVSLVLGARFADRIGKGLRGAPRDALVADVTPVALLGSAFGLRQALDTVGAFLGPLLAIALMLLLANDIRAVLWVAVIPAVIAVSLILLGIREQPQADRATGDSAALQFREIVGLSPAFRDIVIIGVVFTLARFSEAFLILKAVAVGLPLAWSPLVLVVMSAVYAAGAYPAGAASDRIDPRGLLGFGLALLIAADLTLAFSSGIAGVFVGIGLWGAHLAAIQGVLSKLVAQCAPPRLRGSAFGVFNLATGFALLLASVIAGLLWDRFGPAATFASGAAFATIAGAIMLTRLRSIPS